MTNLIETITGFSLMVFFAVSALCIFWYFTTDEGEARAMPRKGRMVYRAGHSFVWMYGVIAVAAIAQIVAQNLMDSFLSMAVLLSLGGAGIYLLKEIKKGR